MADPTAHAQGSGSGGGAAKGLFGGGKWAVAKERQKVASVALTTLSEVAAVPDLWRDGCNELPPCWLQKARRRETGLTDYELDQLQERSKRLLRECKAYRRGSSDTRWGEVEREAPTAAPTAAPIGSPQGHWQGESQLELSHHYAAPLAYVCTVRPEPPSARHLSAVLTDAVNAWATHACGRAEGAEDLTRFMAEYFAESVRVSVTMEDHPATRRRFTRIGPQ